MLLGRIGEETVHCMCFFIRRNRNKQVSVRGYCLMVQQFDDHLDKYNSVQEHPSIQSIAGMTFTEWKGPKKKDTVKDTGGRRLSSLRTSESKQPRIAGYLLYKFERSPLLKSHAIGRISSLVVWDILFKAAQNYLTSILGRLDTSHISLSALSFLVSRYKQDIIPSCLGHSS